MSKTEIASREEVLAMLTEKKRKGQTGAMIALERALRAGLFSALGMPICLELRDLPMPRSTVRPPWVETL